MKTFIKYILTSLVFFSGFNPLYAFEEDKKKHFGVSAGLSMVSYMVAKKSGADKSTALFVGFAVPFIAGLGKELSDEFIDSKDIEANLAGIATGLVFSFVIDF